MDGEGSIESEFNNFFFTSRAVLEGLIYLYN